MSVIKEPKKWYIKLFTLGKNFSSRTFSDNTKKFLLNAVGLFIVVTFTFYVESVGDEYEKREEYLEVVEGIQEDTNSILEYTDEYIEQLNWVLKMYNKQYERWEVNNDSIFLDFIDDEEPNGKFYFAPLSLFNNRDPFLPQMSTYKLFKKGTLEFTLINQSISKKIIEMYDGLDLEYLKSNTEDVEGEIVSQFEKIVNEKWANDLSLIDLEDNMFWIYNRKYIQNDKEVKRILYKRIELWEYSVKDQLKTYKTSLLEGKNMLDSLISVMNKEKYFLYWKLD